MQSDENHEAEPRDAVEGAAETPAEGSAAPAVPPAEAPATEAPAAPTSEEAPLSAGPSEEEIEEEEAAPALGSAQGKMWVALAVLTAVFVVGILGAVGVIHGKGATTTAASLATPAAAPTQAPLATPVVTGGSVAAIVNGHPVPMSTFQLLLNFSIHQNAGQPGLDVKALGGQVMNQVVVDELIRQYAVAHHISVSQAEINKQVQRQEQQLGGASAFQQRLGQFGLTLASYKALVGPALLGQKVEQRIAPLRPVSIKPVPVAHVRHILVAFHPQGNPAQPQAAAPPARSDAVAKARAMGILKQLRHGASFAALARKYSDDPGSAAQGGTFDAYAHQTVAPFDHAAFTLPPHRPTLIRTVYGYHIIEVLSRGKAVPPGQNAAQAATTAQQQKFSAWLNTQLKTAHIKRIAKVAA